MLHLEARGGGERGSEKERKIKMCVCTFKSVHFKKKKETKNDFDLILLLLCCT